MLMAIDRDELYRLTMGSRTGVARPEAMCWKSQFGCDYSLPQPKHDVEGAKKLMAEAGYANGFDLVVSTFTNLEAKSKAEVHMATEAAIVQNYRIFGQRCDRRIIITPATGTRTATNV
jgi:ABC-type transport system substrate-binding protein